jgi:hypothetical protein
VTVERLRHNSGWRVAIDSILFGEFLGDVSCQNEPIRVVFARVEGAIYNKKLYVLKRCREIVR